MANKLKLTRDQLATFLKSHEEIKQFERLILLVEENLNSGLVNDLDSAIGSSLAQSTMNEAMIAELRDLLSRLPVAPDLSGIEAALQALASAPRGIDLSPLESRLSALENIPHGVDLSALEARLDALEGAPVASPALDLARYGSFYSDATQTAAATNTAYAATFNATRAAMGVSVVSNSQVTVDRSGLFEFGYALHFHETTGGSHNAWAWLRVNGVDVPYTTMHFTIAGNGTEHSVGSQHLVRLAAGGYVEAMWAVDNTGIQLAPDASSAFAPAGPSASCTITEKGN